MITGPRLALAFVLLVGGLPVGACSTAPSEPPAVSSYEAGESDDALYDRAYRLYWASRDWDAAEIMMPLAERGHPPAEYWIGSQYLAGRVFAHSDTEAVYWIHRSAEHGYALAQFNLGIMHRDGRRGVPQDAAEAKKWFALAAAQGDSSARAALVELENRPAE